MIQIDMPMPDSCSECRFETKRGFCKAMPDNFCGYTNDEGRPEWCPLQGQEPVKPKYTPKSIYFWECGVCAEPFDRIANYCPKCGRSVKWDDCV